ncbi:hypothetical protein KQI58_16315 [Enterococcus raffinosus]|uniref:hypothetical protein n=1 Tax=Enterococcus raffinosus TaxID=71452 RepID=UPI001C114BCC|nr:hypothetical protein [Enterococcus raffinosus]MBU5362638.1 hypothetical protein [Enterococcus raffinosus]
MSGFKFGKYNDIFKNNLFEAIREYVIKSCEVMVEDSINKNELLPNNEDKIKNRLVFKYLRDDKNKDRLNFDTWKLDFEAENSENYSQENGDIADARLDIKIISEDTLASNERYYTIECKRLDGNKTLNTKYIDEGVARFVKGQVKYASAYKKNFMLGFLVKNFDIIENTEKIDKTQKTNLPTEVVTPLNIFLNNAPSCCVYSGNYRTLKGDLEIHHIFYNVSAAMK